MAEDRNQARRLLRLATSLGPDRLFAASLRAEEAISDLFSFEVGAFSTEPVTDASEALGQAAVISVTTTEGNDRHFHGHISEFEYRGHRQADDAHHYRLVLRPWLWFLSLRQDSRVFQEKTTTDIAQEIFGELSFQDFRIDVSGALPNRVYCVQYRETSLDFLSRLFEEDGIYYYFEHMEDRHTLVLTDDLAAHGPIAGTATLRAARQEMTDDEPGVSDWREVARLTSGMVTLNEYNSEKPRTSLLATVPAKEAPAAASDLEVFDYPGRYTEKSEGDTRANVVMESLEARRNTRSGTSNAFALCPGYTFTLTQHEVDGYNTRHLVTKVVHEAENNWEFGRPSGARYQAQFECIPADIQFRAPVVTPKPSIDGLQTAFVTGPEGEEIHVDKAGRIKVQFHWDRRGEYNQRSSCWVRVAQAWSGIGFGQTFLPRIGMEVAVAFVEGDPDRPIVTGVIHNAVNTPVYDLPANKTRSVIKTNSSPGGGGFNELRFEDKAGQEQIFIHGQKDVDLRVKEKYRGHIGDASHSIVKGDRFEQFDGDQHGEVKGDRSVKIGGIDSLDVGQEIHTKAGMNFAVKAGMEVMVEAGIKLTIKAGSSFITLDPSGVVIQGPLVRINSGGAAGSLSASPAAPQAPEEADQDKAGETTSLTAPKTVPQANAERKRVAQIGALREAAVSGKPFCEICSEAS